MPSLLHGLEKEKKKEEQKIVPYTLPQKRETITIYGAFLLRRRRNGQTTA